MSEPARMYDPDCAAEPAQPEIRLEPSREPPLAWHGFLVRCMLWLSAAYHLVQVWYIFSGRMYYGAEVRDAIYAGLPGMRILDAGLAIVLAAAAALQIAARFHLARRRLRGVRLLKLAHGLLAAGMLGYALARLAIAGLSPLSVPILGQSAACLALLMVNASYYRKRRDIFEPPKGEQA